MTCESVEINFSSNSGTCNASLNLPPESTARSCEIEEGGGDIRDGNDYIIATFTEGNVVARYFNCGQAFCPFVLDGLEVAIDDIKNGTVELNNLTAELYVAAFGQSDGEDVEFAPGSIRVRVTGDVVDSSGTTPLDVLGATVSPAYGTFDGDVLELWSVSFEAGGYTFTAYVSPSECDPL